MRGTNDGLWNRAVVNIAMPGTTSAAKKRTPVVKEHEQLYLVRKPANGASAATNGFRHHRRKENRADLPGQVLDPQKALGDFADNKRGAINQLLELNAHYRTQPWPAPFDKTQHTLSLGDARDLSWIRSGSVHLAVTSPPYWTLKKYETNKQQLGEIEDYNVFLDELDKVWRECARVLAPGGRICCVVGDVCIPRRQGRHLVMPLHADIMVRCAFPRARRAHSDSLVQNRERRYRSQRQRLRILRQALSARCHHQERRGIHSFPSKGWRIPVTVIDSKGAFNAYQGRNEGMAPLCLG